METSKPVEIPRVQADPLERLAAVEKQDLSTLERRSTEVRPVESVVNLEVLRTPSLFREVASGMNLNGDGISTDAMKRDLDRVSAVYREQGRRESECGQVKLSVEEKLKLDPLKFLETVEAEVSANPSCSCEVVKAAITATEATVQDVLAIVQVAIQAAPDQMRIISQCAIASCPEALSEVQALLARFDPNAGESGTDAKSAKSSKDAKAIVTAPADDVAAIPNPLDFPGVGPVGPPHGGPGGQPLFPPNIPVIVTPPSVTIVDP